MLRFVSIAALLVLLVFFAVAYSPGSAEPAMDEGALMSEGGVSSNASSAGITITMTGVVDDED